MILIDALILLLIGISVFGSISVVDAVLTADWNRLAVVAGCAVALVAPTVVSLLILTA